MTASARVRTPRTSLAGRNAAVRTRFNDLFQCLHGPEQTRRGKKAARADAVDQVAMEFDLTPEAVRVIIAGHERHQTR